MGTRLVLQLLTSHGVPVNDPIHLTGGLSRLPLITRILADVLQRPVVAHPVEQGCALGAAVLGAMAHATEAASQGTAAALGESPESVRCAHAAVLASMVSVPDPADIVEPDLAVAAVYDDVFRRYLQVCLFFAFGS